MRRVLLALLVLAACTAAPPHVLMLVVDDLGWNGAFNNSSVFVDRPIIVFVRALRIAYLTLSLVTDVSYHGSEYTTPVIDALAQSGIRLEQYYVQAGDIIVFTSPCHSAHHSHSARHPARRCCPQCWLLSHSCANDLECMQIPLQDGHGIPDCV